MTAPILFPCMLAIGDTLLCGTRDEFLKFTIKSHLYGNVYLLKSSGGKFKPHFVLERTGKLRPLRLIKLRRKMLTWLSPLVDFVLGEYELAEGVHVTCGDLSEKLIGLNNKHTSRTPVLRRFLNKKEEDKIFDATLFKEFWQKSCPKLADEEWQKQYPES